MAAENLHNNLPESALHNPKGFSTASNDTYLTKDSTGGLEWAAKPNGSRVSAELNIGDWDMDTTQTVDVSHGLGDEELIRMVDVMIRDDGSSYTYPLDGKGIISGEYDTNVQGGVGSITPNYIRLVRITNGFFDDTSFNSTSYNRGWVTIWYE